jgi:hypothetical protein
VGSSAYGATALVRRRREASQTRPEQPTTAKAQAPGSGTITRSPVDCVKVAVPLVLPIVKGAVHTPEALVNDSVVPLIDPAMLAKLPDDRPPVKLKMSKVPVMSDAMANWSRPFRFGHHARRCRS